MIEKSNSKEHFKIITCSIPQEIDDLIVFAIEQGWFLSHTDFIRHAIERSTHRYLTTLFSDKLQKINEKPYNYVHFLKEPLTKIQDLQKNLGYPIKEYRNRIYEFRFNGNNNPGWVCIDTAENRDKYFNKTRD